MQSPRPRTATRHRPARRRPSLHRPGWRPLAILLAGAGVLHFVKPGALTPLVPSQLGDPLPWVYGSGIAELACAAGLALPRTRRTAALATVALFVAVFPGNIQMAVDALGSARASTAYQVITLTRLPLQVPLVLWALAVARDVKTREAPAHDAGTRDAR